MSADYTLTVGSVFKVYYSEEDSFEGSFDGMTVIAGATALVFKLNDGSIRFILPSKIVMMDLISMVPAVKEAPKDVGREYYG